ncbi:MAG: LON peptidase substrate-binding domain-containing protein [Candidatus Marinimicrobia bacterium]|jgi:hypothetical protein|nr:LON peptidase substrate-binding domain-containing protein [Candidatus Neomarinimicrobiota bacterium]MDP6594045.1 LON peptidase substrate-binding domain-containing protein [Candidatus Neomarinimicrobiota bacterium]MDP6836566.1 LON peptidase substrate-binding domain-containing protein [Candidatus Neomarinimicrobiota bacterium]MDP6965805.1 LON peptidase substrate-binding domain-containing protein [Candidatus Neomarinimicrobiota bacterium]|tara:strand:- start:7937 stop:8635 length:699 start_codon:yes stop_codon:yes gene_type:complete
MSKSEISLPFGEHLENFSGKAPLFPLPNVVFYPKTFLPLHIFEPRYRKMVQDIEAGERMICMVCLKPEWEDTKDKEAPIYSVGTLGYVEQIEIREDGTSDILLVGLTKVLIQEVKSDRPYRIGKLTPVSDAVGEGDRQKLKKQLLRQFDQIRNDERFAGLTRFFAGGLDFEMAVNFTAAYTPVDIKEKQKLLELDDLSMRARILSRFLESERTSYGLSEDEGSLPPGDLRMN